MESQRSEEEVLELAKKRVKAKKDFYKHLGAYLAVNTILIVIWALTGDATREWSGYGTWTGNKWFLWPLTIWGFFVLINFLQVFIFKPKLDRGEIEKEAEKIKREQR